MSKKSAKIAALIEGCRDKDLDPHYLGYFDCFNQGLYYEAHDVLEELWLADRHGPDGAFYKGLIQLAGAFVHLQKDRCRPARALFQLARANLARYSGVRQRLDITAVLGLIEVWLARAETDDPARNPLRTHPAPRLSLAG